jgi:ankyrin repeat protein
VGSTGNATGPHCHYEIRDRGAVVNPYPYLHGKTLEEINREAVYEMTALFVKKGADLNYRTKLKRTLLHEAAIRYYKLAKLLMKKGVDINVKDYKGRTPLHEAVRANRIKTAVMLLNKGAKVNSRTSEKFKDLNSIVYPAKSTPLKIASLSGFSGMVKVLKNYGARE